MTQLKLTVVLLENEQSQQTIKIELSNLGNKAITAESLHLDVARWTNRIELSGVGSKIPVDFKQTGSHLRISLDSPVAAQSCLSLLLLSEQGLYQRDTDFPSCAYINYGERQESLSPVLEAALLRQQPQASQSKLATPSNDIIIPQPQCVQYLPQTIILNWPLQFQIAEPSPLLKRQFDWMTSQNSALQFNEQHTSNTQAAIALRFEHDSKLSEEAYSLLIEHKQWTICASSDSGRFYALVSLSQLLMNQPSSLPTQKIVDEARFSYRGQMLDCARNFQSYERIKALLDSMAFYKLNRFHWHLTDDEAWRLEIKAYPELCDIGAWRGEGLALCSQFGSGPSKSGGFYSQQQVREIVDYAAMLQIEVIPEIDIPGHARAALKSLPHLLLEEHDQSVYQSVQFYDDNVLNPGLDATVEFLRSVLDEVCELFPSKLVHLGGDEVPPGVWQASPAIDALQLDKQASPESYLFKALQAHLLAKQKQVAGWEEIAHHQLATSAVIYAWNGLDVGFKCAEQGYWVVQCPAQHAYLDMAWDSNPNEPGFHWAGTINLEQSYQWQPQRVGDTRILGTQSQMWSELIVNNERFEYMLFPRICANAEVAWSAFESKNFKRFTAKLNHHQQYWKSRNINAKYLER